MSHQERIQLNDSLKTIIIKLCDGNPGALSVLMKLLASTEKIDSDSALGPYSSFISLDSFGIYGSNIWILYKDVCQESILYTITILRAVQLGIMGKGKLLSILDSINDGQGYGEKIDVENMLLKVQEILPSFGKASLEDIQR